MEFEPEGHQWRITHDWYAQVVAEYPRHGMLHHHLGLLSCKAEGEELHGVYHFFKRWPCYVGLNKYDFSHNQFFYLTLSQYGCHSSPFKTAGELVLPLWLQTAQA